MTGFFKSLARQINPWHKPAVPKEMANNDQAAQEQMTIAVRTLAAAEEITRKSKEISRDAQILARLIQRAA